MGHLSICRPRAKNSQIYDEVRQFIEKCLSNAESIIDFTNQTTQPENNSSRDFWVKRLEAKQKELDIVEAELNEERNLGNEDKLTVKAERLLREIEQIKTKII